MSSPASLSWITNLRGKFVVFDGPDGSGKSTQFSQFSAWCVNQGLSVTEVREPGGTDIGEQIRNVLLDTRNDGMDLRCEMLLYMASRAQLVVERIRPALAKAHLVLADRFISSTLAYQGSGGGLPRDTIMRVGEVAVGETWPDLTVIFDVDEKTANERLVGTSSRRGRRGTSGDEPGLFADRMELQGSAYRERVRNGYREQATGNPEGYLLIDASAEPSVVFDRLVQGLASRYAS